MVRTDRIVFLSVNIAYESISMAMRSRARTPTCSEGPTRQRRIDFWECFVNRSAPATGNSFVWRASDKVLPLICLRSMFVSLRLFIVKSAHKAIRNSKVLSEHKMTTSRFKGLQFGYAEAEKESRLNLSYS
jgi:hypothetical protein